MGVRKQMPSKVEASGAYAFALQGGLSHPLPAAVVAAVALAAVALAAVALAAAPLAVAGL